MEASFDQTLVPTRCQLEQEDKVDKWEGSQKHNSYIKDVYS